MNTEYVKSAMEAVRNANLELDTRRLNSESEEVTTAWEVCFGVEFDFLKVFNSKKHLIIRHAALYLNSTIRLGYRLEPMGEPGQIIEIDLQAEPPNFEGGCLAWCWDNYAKTVPHPATASTAPPSE